MSYTEERPCPICARADVDSTAILEFEVIGPEPSVGIMGASVNALSFRCEMMPEEDMLERMSQEQIRDLEDEVDLQLLWESLAYPEYD